MTAEVIYEGLFRNGEYANNNDSIIEVYAVESTEDNIDNIVNAYPVSPYIVSTSN